MNLIYKTAADTFLLLKKHLSKRKHRKTYARDELPLRAELFSSEQMKQHGKNLASLHQLTGKKATERLLERLHENEDVLIETIRRLTTVVKENNPVAPAEEWLLDNFYLIEENIRTSSAICPADSVGGFPGSRPDLPPVCPEFMTLPRKLFLTVTAGWIWKIWSALLPPINPFPA